MTLKDLTLRLVMLLALLTGQRHQTIHSLDISHMDLKDDKCTFYINKVLKHTKPGKHQKPIELLAFKADARLCIIWHLNKYLEKTSHHRNNQNQLLLSFQKPYKSVSKDTISRWIKVVLKAAGINTNVFLPHSTRSASTSAVKSKGTSLEVILNSAGWSNCKVFAKHYDKVILSKPNFGAVLLK